MPAKKPKPPLNITEANTVTIDTSYGAVPYYNVDLGSSMSIDTISIDTSQWGTSIGSITSPYTYSSGNQGIGAYSITNTATLGSVHIDGNGLTMNQGADIKIGGRSLTDAIDKIEQRLAILKPNPELESRWQQLQDLREQYVELERDLLEKEKIMKILKES